MKLFAIAIMGWCIQGFGLDFPKAGFSIDVLDSKPPTKSASYTTLMMFLPASGGFAPNVNVQVQSYPDSLDAYWKLSRGQFDSLGMTVHTTKSLSKKRRSFEYSGKSQGRELHWYAIAEKKGGSIYLVTATATPDQWPQHKARLIQTVNSFKVR